MQVAGREGGPLHFWGDFNCVYARIWSSNQITAAALRTAAFKGASRAGSSQGDQTGFRGHWLAAVMNVIASLRMLGTNMRRGC